MKQAPTASLSTAGATRWFEQPVDVVTTNMNQVINAGHQAVTGIVQCFVVEAATGKVLKEYPPQKNLVLNQGLDQVATNYWADLMLYCSAGTGVTPTSDDSGTTTATQAGTGVTLSGGSFTFTDTATDAGKVIKWDTAEEATIVTVTNPTTVVVSNSASISAGEFTVYRTNQTQLTTQLKRTSTYLTSAPYCQSTLTSNVYKNRRTYDFTAEVGTVNYTEVALGWSNTGSTTIFSRILLASPVAVGAGQQFRVTYEMQLTLLPASASAATAIINGWPVAPALTTDGDQAIQYIGLSQVTSSSGSTGFYDNGRTANEPAEGTNIGIFLATNATAPSSLGSAVNRTTGAEVVSATKASYIAGSYYIDKTATFPVGSGNGSAWRSMGFGPYSAGFYHPYSGTSMVFVFDEAQTKLNTHTLTLTWRFSWSRVLS